MSLVEMEESLKASGDAELDEMKVKAEPLYDGTVDRFIRDNNGQHFAAFIKCKEHFGDQHVYCHKVHINHIQSGDKVRFAVHFNAKKATASELHRPPQRSRDEPDAGARGTGEIQL